MKREYLSLPPEKAIPAMREELYALFAQEGNRVDNPNGTKLPKQLFMLAHMVEYLLVLASHQQEAIDVLRERLGS